MTDRERALWATIEGLEAARRLEREAAELREAAWRGVVGPKFPMPAPFITDGVSFVGPGLTGPDTSAVAHVATFDGGKTETWFAFGADASEKLDLGTLKGKALGMIKPVIYPARLPFPVEAGSQPDVAFRAALVPGDGQENPTTAEFVNHLCAFLGANGLKDTTRVAQATFQVQDIAKATSAKDVLPADGENLGDSNSPRRWSEELFVLLGDGPTLRGYLYGEWDDGDHLRIHQVWKESFALPPVEGTVVRSRKTTLPADVHNREEWFDHARHQLADPSSVRFATATVQRWDPATAFCP